MRCFAILVSLCLCCQAANAQLLFSQNFDSSVNIISYVSATPNAGQFTYAAAGNANSSVQISGKKLRVARTDCAGAGLAAVARTANLATTAPGLIKVSFRMNVTNSGSSFAVNNPPPVVLALFNIGSSFTNDLASNTSSTHTRLAIYSDSATTGRYHFRDGNSTGTTTASSVAFIGEKKFTMYINNSGSVQTYTGPDSASYSISNDKWDMWEGSSNRFFSNLPAVSTSNTILLQNFKLFFYQNSGAIVIDDLVFTAL